MPSATSIQYQVLFEDQSHQDAGRIFLNIKDHDQHVVGVFFQSEIIGYTVQDQEAQTAYT